MRIVLSAMAGFLLCSCASSSRTQAPRFAEQMDPAWNGVLDSTVNLGVMIVSRPGVYTRAGFEALASTDDALRPLVPGLRWTAVDSSSPLIENLRGWDLDSLSLQLLADPMVWNLPWEHYGDQLVLREAKLSEKTRESLRRVGSALDLQMLVALRSGDVRPDASPAGARVALSDAEREKARIAAASGSVLAAVGDSARSVSDEVWFGVFDLRSGALWYGRDFRAEGARTSAFSAEGEWARSAWRSFVDALRELPGRKARALAAEPR